MAVTMRDIAEIAGVSSSAVAHVLSGNARTRRISKKTQQAILRITKSLDYRSNPIARQLRTGRTNRLGLVIRNFSNPWASHIAQAMQTEATQHGLAVHASSWEARGDSRKATIEAVLDAGADGIIATYLAAFFDGWHEYFSGLWKQRIPCIIAAELGKDAEIPCDSVMIELQNASFEALEHLYSLGHRRIAYIRVGPKKALAGGGRDSAVKDFAGVHKFKADDLPILYVAPTIEGGAKAGRELLKMHPRPTAVFASKDIIALGMIGTLRAGGLRVPEDVSIVGCGNIDLGRFQEKPLSTISWPYGELAKLCIQQIRARIHDKDWLKPVRRELKSKLIVRQTTAVCPVRGDEV
ncbi:MAG: substrate-binding domain-containing protein [Actinobacteria bacterium]|nr:substrate-binding domain-containing protein [Actinomycetota bacterium]